MVTKGGTALDKYSLALVFSDAGDTEEAAVWPRKKKKPNAAKSTSNSNVSNRYVLYMYFPYCTCGVRVTVLHVHTVG